MEKVPSAEEATATKSSLSDDAVETVASLPQAQPPTATLPPPAEDEESSQTVPSQTSNQLQPANGRPFDTGNRQIMVHGVRRLKKDNAQGVANEWVQQAKQKYDTIPKDGSIEKVKKPPFGSWMVLTVSDETMVQPMIDFLNSGAITLGANEEIRAHHATNNQGKRKDRNNDNDSNDTKRQRKDDERDVVFISEEHLRNKVTPLWKLSKEEQKDTKVKELIRKCAMKIVQGVNSRIRFVP